MKTKLWFILLYGSIISYLPSKVSLAATFDDLPPTIPPTTTGTYAATKAMTPGSTTKQRAKTTDKSTKKSTSPIKNTLKSPENLTQSQQIECPKDVEAPFTLFPIPCTTNKECKREGANQICCKLFGNKRCVEGKNVQPKEPRHEPILFVIPRRCPKTGETLAETWWNVQTCETDQDCWPRVCCPDGKLKYCRTSQPELESAQIPVARQLASPYESFTQYLQCTPPPPPVFDPHPKTCNNTFDCFPNLCCQEAGKKHCRPPKRSLLSLLTSFGPRFSNISFIRDWTENLVIR